MAPLMSLGYLLMLLITSTQERATTKTETKTQVPKFPQTVAITETQEARERVQSVPIVERLVTQLMCAIRSMASLQTIKEMQQSIIVFNLMMMRNSMTLPVCFLIGLLVQVSHQAWDSHQHNTRPY